MAREAYLTRQLEERESQRQPVNVAVAGAGWFGRGLVRELRKWPGMEVRVICDRTPEKALKLFQESGIASGRVVVAHTAQDLQNGLRNGKYLVSTNVSCLAGLAGIDAAFDATGDVRAGAEMAQIVLAQGVHFLTTSSELDATVGYVLNQLAEEQGAVYSNSDGDQPGVLAQMIEEVKRMGFQIAVAGNGKGFLNYHADPEDIAKYVRPGDSSRKITSFTDGTKQSLELAVLANGADLTVGRRGMHGVRTTRKNLVRDVMQAVQQEGVVEYFMGTDDNYGMTVFVIGKREEAYARDDLAYLRRGDGPYYLFFRDYHLCYFEAPKTIAEVVLLQSATIRPRHLNADVVAVAKKDLKCGEPLDGIGGYCVYGLLDRYANLLHDRLLPLGLAEYAVVTRDIPRDTPISYDMVEFSADNPVLQLRRRQDAIAASLFGGETTSRA